MNKVVIFGNQSTAMEAFCFLRHYSDYKVVAFTVDKDYLEADQYLGIPISPFESIINAYPPESHNMLIAVGYVQNNRVRRDRYFLAKELGYQLVNFISPNSIIFPGSVENDNCIIGHYCVISPKARIGSNVIIGNGCTIGHDVIIEDHCFLSNSVSIAGSVTVGERCYLGTNSTIRNKVKIGKNCVIGAGAIILENANSNSVYIGEPATLLPINSDELPLG